MDSSIYEASGVLGRNGIPDLFQQRQDAFRRIFTLLGADASAAETLDNAVSVSQAWVRGDYGYNDSLPVDLDDADGAMLRRLCEDDLGMQPAWVLPEGQYDTLLVFGASQFGNVRRTEQLACLLENTAYSFSRVVLLGGERSLYKKEVPGMRRLLQSQAIRQQTSDDDWLADIVNQFDEHFPKDADLDSVDTSIYRLFGETVQMRASMIAAIGNVVLHGNTTKLNAASGKYVGVNNLDISTSGQTFEATLLHCPPHPRKNGPDRHTTESCINDFTNVLGIRSDETVAFIGAQPHLMRMQMTVLRAFKQLGYADVQVVVTGPELDGGTPVQICASEVYKTLYELKILRDSLGF